MITVFTLATSRSKTPGIQVRAGFRQRLLQVRASQGQQPGWHPPLPVGTRDTYQGGHVPWQGRTCQTQCHHCQSPRLSFHHQPEVQAPPCHWDTTPGGTKLPGGGGPGAAGAGWGGGRAPGGAARPPVGTNCAQGLPGAPPPPQLCFVISIFFNRFAHSAGPGMVRHRGMQLEADSVA